MKTLYGSNGMPLFVLPDELQEDFKPYKHRGCGGTVELVKGMPKCDDCGTQFPRHAVARKKVKSFRPEFGTKHERATDAACGCVFGPDGWKSKCKTHDRQIAAHRAAMQKKDTAAIAEYRRRHPRKKVVARGKKKRQG